MAAFRVNKHDILMKSNYFFTCFSKQMKNIKAFIVSSGRIILNMLICRIISNSTNQPQVISEIKNMAFNTNHMLSTVWAEYFDNIKIYYWNNTTWMSHFSICFCLYYYSLIKINAGYHLKWLCVPYKREINVYVWTTPVCLLKKVRM